MQKTVHLPDGQTIYINIEGHHWLRDSDTKHPKPNLHIIHDLLRPIAPVEKISVQDGQIYLHITDVVYSESGMGHPTPKQFPISGELFLELLHPDHLYPATFSRDNVAILMSELLTQYWDCLDGADDKDRRHV